MAIWTFLRCPHCGESYGSYHRTIRKESGPLAVRCRRCNRYINLSNLALEWELLTEDQRFIRYLSTGLVATVTGGGYSLLITLGIFVFYMLAFKPTTDSSVSVDKPVFLIPFALIAAFLIVWQFRRMMAADIEGSQRRLKDPEYRQLLRSMGKTFPEEYDHDT